MDDLLQAFSSFEEDHNVEAEQMSKILNTASDILARSEQSRSELGETEALWPPFKSMWTKVTDDVITSIEPNSLDICLAMARFTRNLVAGVPANQEKSFVVEPSLRTLIHCFTSFSRISDESTLPSLRTLTQALSNIVTSNENLLPLLWKDYLEDVQNILGRLLEAKDNHTLTAALILILNCINQSQERCRLLVETPAGVRLCVSLLDKGSILFDEGDDTKTFDIVYQIFKNIFDVGLAENLWKVSSHPGEIITPHQGIFLKFLDSYLQTAPSSSSYQFLVLNLLELSTFAQDSIRAVLPPENVSIETIEVSNPAPDLRLPRVCEALVLLSQCIISLLLKENSSEGFTQDILAFTKIATSSQGQGLIESITELLRLLNQFLPRINFGKAVTDATVSLPQGPATSDPAGFAYVKRDLVRLLGIICHNDREVQDKIRFCGGIHVVLNLCVVDERNPYLREHALFTLRNILHGNLENQAVVEELKLLDT